MKENEYPDVNLCSWDPNYAVSIDWVKTNLATTDTTFAFNNGWGHQQGFTVASLGNDLCQPQQAGHCAGQQNRKLGMSCPGGSPRRYSAAIRNS